MLPNFLLDSNLIFFPQTATGVVCWEVRSDLIEPISTQKDRKKHKIMPPL